MKTRTTLATSFFILALAVGMASTATAADDNEETNVTVTVSAETALDVKPDDLQYSSAEVGSRVNNSDNGFDAVKVENTGSEDISQIWLDTTMPSTDPFGQGDSQAHNSANFLQIKPRDNSANAIRGDATTYHYIQRAEFFESNTPLIETGDDWNSEGYSDFEIGRMRLGSDEFYYVIANDGGNCDGSGSPSAKMRVADTATTPSGLGTYDFSDSGSDYTEYNITTASNSAYGISQSTVTLDNGTETHEYDIMTACASSVSSDFDEPHILMNRYNIEAGGATDLQANDGTVTEQIYRSTSDSDDLNPGASFTVDVAVQVPRGVPQGQLSEGTMTVKAKTSTNT